ncbi:YciI family protein [Luteimonas sp. SJ-92]|uniref:YciI family protein n=1 Tax=Luteimonas salinisoli TaxID=2752307 RepID=A0A853J9F7_9GAMM|nr:YciI family protein [Luteimonas salinisoli]NZA25783.1 YciI family protein [Luteimonas salinisoli]
MRYAIFCYDCEDTVAAWSGAEDAQVMQRLGEACARLDANGARLGPSARLMPTVRAVTVRSGSEPMVLDGPFAETKEQLLGLWLLDCDTLDEAVAAARELAAQKSSGAFEVRPVQDFFAAGAFAAGAQSAGT